ncbi:MAG: AAA family ATPase [Clostridia bacterium]|nr:AAA family ATPase [Clostridia bacterium]
MNTRDFLSDIYSDFFGIEKLEAENEKMRKELGLDKVEVPVIEVKKPGTAVVEGEKLTGTANEKEKDLRDKEMVRWFTKIDEMYITDASKNFLKKIIEYMRKYNEQIEKSYISFHMQIVTKNKEIVEDVAQILHESNKRFAYLKSGNIGKVSMYDVGRKEDISRTYVERNSIVVLKDLKGLDLAEERLKDVVLYAIEENVSSATNKTITIVSGSSKDEINSFFAKNSNLLEKNFSFVVEEAVPDTQDVYNDILKRLEGNMELSDEMKVSLLDYISNTYSKTSLDFPAYRDNLYNSIVFNKEIPKYHADKSLEEIFADLNELVGLQKVKKVLNDLVDLIELKNKTKDDLKIKDINLHMVFLGNPGTGKTTVARIIAEILYNLNYIKQNKLIEVSSKDLVGEYVGQTAPKTMSVVEKALGGVLFVDEAYSLASGGREGNGFNEEAIATLIQAMENYRDNLVVIFAGYTEEMQDFLNANSGIVSRIGYTLEFDDYTPDELIAIFNGMMKKSGFIVTDDAITEVRKLIDEYKGTKNFGNARFVRSVYEKSILKHASNTKNKKRKSILKTITKEDISAEDLLKM